MTNLKCKGNETTIEDCDYRKFDSDSRNKAAGVECYGKEVFYELSTSKYFISKFIRIKKNALIQ